MAARLLLANANRRLNSDVQPPAHWRICAVRVCQAPIAHHRILRHLLSGLLGMDKNPSPVEVNNMRDNHRSDKGGALVATSALHERVMVAQAQKILAGLEALAVLNELAGEMYGAD